MKIQSVMLAAAGLAMASTAMAQLPGDIEVRMGSNPVLGSGTLFAALFDGPNGTGTMTNVPAAAVGFNPAVPFTGSLVIGNSFTIVGLPFPGSTTVNTNNTGLYPGPTYGAASSTVPGSWTGIINLVNGFATTGSFTISLGGIFAGETYTADVRRNTAAFVASGVNTFTLQGLSNHGAFSGPSFGGQSVAPWFAGQGIGDQLFGGFVFSGSNSPGVPNGLYSLTATATTYIPTPGAAALMGLGGLAAFRRRRA